MDYQGRWRGVGCFELLFVLLFVVNTGFAFQVNSGYAKVRHESGDLCNIGVMLDIGPYIHIFDQSPIMVQQYGMAGLYRTYRGCKVTDVWSNYPFLMIVSAHGVVDGSGKWRAEVGPEKYIGGWTDNYSLKKGVNRIKICVQGENVDITKFPASYAGMKVAEVIVQLLPL